LHEALQLGYSQKKMRKAGRQEKVDIPFSCLPGFLILFLFSDDEAPAKRVKVLRKAGFMPSS
jgi:hypothetical protein